jgi:hypothetical protein
MMPTPTLAHTGYLEERPTSRRTVWTVNGACTCGWAGPARRDSITAADDTARHLLEAQS